MLEDAPRNPPDLGQREVTRGLVARFRLSALLRRFDERHVRAGFLLVNGFVTIALLGVLAWITRQPFVFPSLGPTAFLFFFSPAAASATPRNAIIGHAIGILCGYGSLLAFGLAHAGPATAAGVSLARVLAAALSFAATGSLMILARAAHPPAGATTLLVSLGAISSPGHLVLIEVAVALLALQAIALNRVAGIDYPRWARHPLPLPHDREPRSPAPRRRSAWYRRRHFTRR